MRSLNTRDAAAQIHSGELVVTPTEAVYGLSCDPRNDSAIQRLLALKNRPAGKGLIVMITDLSQISDLIQPLSGHQMVALQQSWPGPVTFLLPAKPETSRLLRGDFETLAVRMTAHPKMRALISHLDSAVISTSANLAGEPATNELMKLSPVITAGIAGVLEGRLGESDQPSQIIDLETGQVIR